MTSDTGIVQHGEEYEGVVAADEDNQQQVEGVPHIGRSQDDDRDRVTKYTEYAN